MTASWILLVVLPISQLAPSAYASATPAGAAASPLPSYAPGDNRLLVGISVRGREVATLDVLRIGQFFVPLEEFAEFADIEIVEDADGVHLMTPIGVVTLEDSDIREVDGIRYLAESAIEEKLASPVRFDPQEFALDFDLAWTPAAERVEAGEGPELVPDVRPPGLSLSTLRLDAQYIDTEHTGSTRTVNTLFAGRADGGRWQTRLTTDFRGDTRWQDYAWIRANRRHLWLVGHQRVQLHPVLPGLEVTGVQAALTNQSLSLFSRTFEPGELLPRHLRPVDSFTGSGPPAGVAELRLDGSIIARTSIGLNGLWEFYEVPVQSYQYTRIEVWLYERHNILVPVEIQDQARTTSSFLLPKGAYVHQGGIGYSGNLIEDLRNDRERSYLSGFYQWRQGLTSNLTLEAAFQKRPDRFQAMVGVVARPRRDLVFSAAFASSDGAQSYHFELDWRQPQWYLRGVSQLNRAGFVSDVSVETYDHYLELGYSPWHTLDVGLIGRRLLMGSQESDFILPAVAWHPSPILFLQARPNQLGEYVVNLSYNIRDIARFSAYHQGRTFLDLSIWPTDRTSVFAGAELGGDLDARYSLSGQIVFGGRFRPGLLAGPLYSDGKFGYRLKTSLAVAPGVLLRVEFTDDPIRVPVQRNGRRILVALNADLTWAHGKVMPAYSRGLREDRGGIAGIVTIKGGASDSEYDLENLKIIVRGRPIARTGRGGRFFVSNIREGVYRVRLDTENLPIELQPSPESIVAQVAGGAVTRLEFTVRPEYGIAGRITDNRGRRLPGISVKLIARKQKIEKRGRTDQFGLFRIDGLPPGTYLLQVIPGQLPEGKLPSREVVISDDFLFGQDLRLPFALDENP